MYKFVAAMTRTSFNVLMVGAMAACAVAQPIPATLPGPAVSGYTIADDRSLAADVPAIKVVKKPDNPFHPPLEHYSMLFNIGGRIVVFPSRTMPTVDAPYSASLWSIL